MKKTVALLMTLMILAAVAAPTFAQGRSRRAYCDQARTSNVDIETNSRFGRPFLTTVG
jgi:hypothetical protein